MIRSDLLPRPGFRSGIAGWINMACTDFHRTRLKPLGDALARHPAQLQDWARGLRMERGFPPLPWAVKWEDHMQMLSLRM